MNMNHQWSMTSGQGPPHRAMLKKWPRLTLLFILLLAFGLHVYDLEGQSLWRDEGLNVYRAQQPLANVLANVITIDGVDVHHTAPPLYFLLLRLLRAVAGEAVFSLRFLGVMAGVLSIPFMYRLGKETYDAGVGVGAALLLAISPFHVWQSREISNGSLLVLLSLAALYGLSRFVLSNYHWGKSSGGVAKRWRWLLLWGGATLASIYAHDLGLLVLAGSMWLMIGVGAYWWWQRRLLKWPGITIIFFSLAAIPVTLAALSHSHTGPQIDFVFLPIHHLLSRVVSIYSIGFAPDVVHRWWWIAPAVILAIAGMIATLVDNRWFMMAFMLAYLFMPLTILARLSVISPRYNDPHHLLIGLPLFLLLVAAGGLRRWGKWHKRALALFLIVIISQAAWLYTQFTAPQLTKDDVRGAAHYLSQVARPDDVIVLHDTITSFTFDYYYSGAAPWVAIPAFGQHEVEQAIEHLRATASGAQRLWFLAEPRPQTGFPQLALTEWATALWPRLLERRFASLWLGVNLMAYAPEPAFDTLPETAIPLEVNWEGELALSGYESPPMAAAGNFWQPTFYWAKGQSTASEYMLSLRFTDSEGQIWAQLDQPLWPDYPPAAWPMNTLIRHKPVMAVPAGLPSGSYQVWLRVTRQADNQALPANRGGIDFLLRPALTVRAATASQASIDQLPDHTPVRAHFSHEITLLGYNIPDTVYKPGHPIPISLYWQVDRRPTADYRLRLQLLAADGQVINEALFSPSKSDYSPTLWQPGELLANQVSLLVPATAEAGQYTLHASLIQPDTGQALSLGWLPGRKSVGLAKIRVEPWSLITELPPIQTPLRADFGRPASIELHGYELSTSSAKAGETLTLTLFWRAVGQVGQSYTVFVHLTDANEQIAGQGDGLPVDGFRPTSSWRVGEALVDRHFVPISPDASPGVYSLSVGFYDSATGQRLAVFSNGEQQRHDRILLTQVEITP